MESCCRAARLTRSGSVTLVPGSVCLSVRSGRSSVHISSSALAAGQRLKVCGCVCACVWVWVEDRLDCCHGSTSTVAVLHSSRTGAVVPSGAVGETPTTKREPRMCSSEESTVIVIVSSAFLLFFPFFLAFLLFSLFSFIFSSSFLLFLHVMFGIKILTSWN